MVLLALSKPLGADPLDALLARDAEGLRATTRAQQTVERLDEQTTDLLNRYLDVHRETRLAEKHRARLNGQAVQLGFRI